MTIINSEIVINRPNGSVFNRRVREKHWDHISPIPHRKSYDKIFTTDPADHTSGEPPVLDEVAYQAALDVEIAPTLAANAVIQQEQLAQQEIQQWISEMEAGNDPWHSTPFVNVTPEFNTWLVAASESLKFWLQKDDRQELLNCQLSVGNTSNNDMDDLLLLTGSSFSRVDLSSQIQIAVNTQVDLDTYSPSVGE